MSEGHDNGAELGPSEQRLGEQLAAQRPVPAAGFRGALRRQLAASDPGYGPRPARLRTEASAFLGAGGLLVIMGGLQAAGAL